MTAVNSRLVKIAPLILLLIVLAANWPLFVYSMKFDNLDQYLPWRLLVGDCIRNGMLPVWNPYTHLGYPLHADPQSGAWYPIVWLIGGLSGYNVYWIHIEYILHVWIGGFGMYLLIKNYIKNADIALLAGISYMLSGFFNGNAQHLTWIISGAWWPFIILFFMMMIRTQHWKYALLLALVYFMMLTGGYPAFSIVTAYILIATAVIYLVIQRKNKSFCISLLKNGAVAGSGTLLISSVMLVSSYISFQLAGRAEGLSKDLAMANPFSPQAMISFLFPLASIRNPEFFDTDISMSNGFFGLLLLIGFIYSFFRKKSKAEWIILIGSILFLMAAMGKYTPVRSLMFDYLPLMKLFRMPSLFRLFAISGFIILGAKSLLQLREKKSFHIIFAGLLIIYIASIIFFITKNDFSLPDKFSDIISSTFTTGIVLQATVMILAIILMIIFNKKKWPVYLLSADLIFSAWICAPVTLVNSIPVQEANHYITNLDHGFPLPASGSMQNYRDRENTFGPFWCNLGILKKQTIYDGYNNFQTKQYLGFEQLPHFKYVLKNPLAYFTSSEKAKLYIDENDTTAIYSDSSFIYLDNKPKVAVSQKMNNTVVFTLFKPNAITLKTHTSNGYLTLMQQFDKNWTASIDDKATEIFRSNRFNMSLYLTEGDHEIKFNYHDNRITAGLWISAISLLLISLLILRVRNNSMNQK